MTYNDFNCFFFLEIDIIEHWGKGMRIFLLGGDATQILLTGSLPCASYYAKHFTQYSPLAPLTWILPCQSDRKLRHSANKTHATWLWATGRLVVHVHHFAHHTATRSPWLSWQCHGECSWWMGSLHSGTVPPNCSAPNSSHVVTAMAIQCGESTANGTAGG